MPVTTCADFPQEIGKLDERMCMMAAKLDCAIVALQKEVAISQQAVIHNVESFCIALRYVYHLDRSAQFLAVSSVCIALRYGYRSCQML